MFTMLGVNDIEFTHIQYVHTHANTRYCQQTHTEQTYIISKSCCELEGSGNDVWGGKNGWNKRSLLYFLKKRSFEDPLFHCTGIKHLSNNKLLETRWSRFRWCNFSAEYPEKLQSDERSLVSFTEWRDFYCPRFTANKAKLLFSRSNVQPILFFSPPFLPPLSWSNHAQIIV